MKKNIEVLLVALLVVCATCLVAVYSPSASEVSFDGWRTLTAQNARKIESVKTKASLRELFGDKMLYFRLQGDKKEYSVKLNGESRQQALWDLRKQGIGVHSLDDVFFVLLVYSIPVLAVASLICLAMKLPRFSNPQQARYDAQIALKIEKR